MKCGKICTIENKKTPQFGVLFCAKNIFGVCRFVIRRNCLYKCGAKREERFDPQNINNIKREKRERYKTTKCIHCTKHIMKTEG